MLENDGRPPSREDQVREAESRNTSGKTAKAAPVVETETAPETGDDLAAPELDFGAEPGRQQSQEAPRGKAPPINADAEKAYVMGKTTRDQIVKNWREKRTQEENDGNNELREFNQQGMPEELLDQVSQEPFRETGEGEQRTNQAQGENESDQEPEGEQVYVIKVRGKEIELTEAQLEALASKVEGPGTVVEKAQKAAATDDYMKEIRDVLAETKRMRDEILAQRGGPSATHPGGQDTTQKTEQANAEGDIAHPDDSFQKAIEAIQFGNPEEAAKILREAVTKATVSQAKGASEDAITEQQMKRELDRAVRIGQAFEEANPELAKDEIARDTIINRCVKLQYEDLVALSKEIGIDAAKIPRNSAEIQHWHRFYRAKSFNVRDPEALLNKAKDDFLAWKNGSAPLATTETTPNGKARVEISVQRRTRRAAIPQQPSRTVTPRPDARPQQSAPRDRSSIVQEMREARNTPKLPMKAIAATRAQRTSR